MRSGAGSGGEHDPPANDRRRDFPLHAAALERGVLALADEGVVSNLPQCFRIEDADIGRGADGELAGRAAEDGGGVAGDAGERGGERQLCGGGPFQGQRQQQFERSRAGVGFAEGQCLAVLVDRGVIRADRGEAAGGGRGQRFTVALCAQRRVPAITSLSMRIRAPAFCVTACCGGAS